MPIYNIKFIRHEEVADGTMAFHFEKPSGFEFKAGQFLEMTLLNPPHNLLMWGMNPPEPGSENTTASAEGGRKTVGSRISTAWETDADLPAEALAKVGGNNRAFSIASAPYESDLMITTRMRDTAFKRVLKTLPSGTEIQIEGPFGDFTLHNNVSRPAVFLTGGIGITPVRSIVIEAAQRNLPHKIFLFYSNRQKKDAAFLGELQELETKNPNYKFIPTMTDLGEPGSENATASAEGGSNATGSRISTTWERGYINEQMLKKYLGDLNGPIYYSVGPPLMVMAMRKMLNDAGVDDDDIKTEEFAGY